MNDDPRPGPVYRGYSYDHGGYLSSVVEFPPEPAGQPRRTGVDGRESSPADPGPSSAPTVTDPAPGESGPGDPGDDWPPEAKVIVTTYDRAGRPVSVEHLSREQWRRREEQRAACAGPPPPHWEHDPAARVFRLAAADGTVEVFRDAPTRYLCVEPDPRTGAMRPAWKHGRPVYLYLCREEREAH